MHHRHAHRLDSARNRQPRGNAETPLDNEKVGTLQPPHATLRLLHVPAHGAKITGSTGCHSDGRTNALFTISDARTGTDVTVTESRFDTLPGGTATVAHVLSRRKPLVQAQEFYAHPRMQFTAQRVR